MFGFAERIDQTPSYRWLVMVVVAIEVVSVVGFVLDAGLG